MEQTLHRQPVAHESMLQAPCSPKFLLESHHYTDPAWEPIEQTQIFHKTWLYVGDGQQLSPGQAWIKSVAGQPIVITCIAPGQYQAFHNVCPHRAALLCPDHGIHTQKHLVCPYHAWVYSLEGHLVGVPSKARFPDDFAPENYDLKPIRLATWSDFLFVCLSGDGRESVPPLDTFLGSIPKELGRHRRPTTQRLWSQSRRVACNWKNYHDNTLCDYHVAIAHRTTLHRLQGPIKHYAHRFEPYTNLLFSPVPPSWREENTVLADLSDLAQNHFFTYGIFPNLHLLGFPNGLLAWIIIEPLTVDTCQVRLEVYGIPSASPSVDTLKAEFEAFMAEDMALTEGVQQGYASGTYVPGPVNRLEARIVQQQQLILECLKTAPMAHQEGDR